MSEPQSKNNRLLSFFSKPIVGILGSIASIIGLILAIYFYVGGKQSPDLTYSINPTRLELINAKQSSSFSINFNGKAVEGDITTAQIAFWNQGKSPIKKEDIIQDIFIYTEPSTSILEASLTKSSRDLLQIALGTDEFHQGRIPITWKILEQGDGGVIEIIYNGTSDINFYISGAVVGQKEITRYNNKIGFQSPEEEYEFRRMMNKRRRIVSIPMAVFFGIGFIFLIVKILRDKTKLSSFEKRGLVIAAMLLVVLIVLMVLMFNLSQYPTSPSNL